MGLTQSAASVIARFRIMAHGAVAGYRKALLQVCLEAAAGSCRPTAWPLLAALATSGLGMCLLAQAPAVLYCFRNSTGLYCTVLLVQAELSELEARSRSGRKELTALRAEVNGHLGKQVYLFFVAWMGILSAC